MTATVTYHPWRRFFAKLTDFLIAFALVGVVFFVVVITSQELLVRIVTLPWLLKHVLFVCCLLLVQAAMVSLCGMTPGKFVFGMRLGDNAGKKLRLHRALWRELFIWVAGIGLAVLPVTIVCFFLCHRYYKKNGEAYWDRVCGSVVTYL